MSESFVGVLLFACLLGWPAAFIFGFYRGQAAAERERDLKA